MVHDIIVLQKIDFSLGSQHRFFSPLSGRRPRTAADVKKINKINGVVQGPAVKDDCDILET